MPHFQHFSPSIHEVLIRGVAALRPWPGSTPSLSVGGAQNMRPSRLFCLKADLVIFGAPAMRQPDNFHWWLLVVFSVLIVSAWPPRDDKSLAAKFLNWAVDPDKRAADTPRPARSGPGRRSRQGLRARPAGAAVRRAVSQRRLDAKASRMEGRRRSVRSGDRAAGADGRGRGRRIAGLADWRKEVDWRLGELASWRLEATNSPIAPIH